MKDYSINYTEGPKRHGWQWFWWLYGWVFVRPRRWFFWKMVWNYRPRWWFEKRDYEKSYRWPNIHWYVLYHTVFNLCSWLYYEGWRPFAVWKDGMLREKPLLCRIIQRIGHTTAGYTIMGSECHHCSSELGNQVDLADNCREDGQVTFILRRTWTIDTPDGTDHRFNGTTICPVCGFRDYYEDGSL